MKFAEQLSAQVSALDPRLTLVFVPAEDDSVDPEIQLHQYGKETGVTIQIGAGYAGVNRWVEAEQASYSLFFGETPSQAGDALLRMIRDQKIP
ncbi:MAG: hypothetical protein DI537_10060 [Stutzerimonas stutzeri]|nr:MAG: hypothetical protein DI537_10060 [Stutzerimonas stutzeri]